MTHSDQSIEQFDLVILGSGEAAKLAAWDPREPRPARGRY